MRLRRSATVALGVLVLAMLGIVGLTATAGASINYTFAATADATAKSGSPNANFGTATTLTEKISNQQSFLSFSVSGLDGNITAATLKVYLSAGTLGSSVAVATHSVTGTWTETGVTWTNKPATSGVERCNCLKICVLQFLRLHTQCRRRRTEIDRVTPSRDFDRLSTR